MTPLHSSPPPPHPILRRHPSSAQLHKKDRGPPWVDVEEQKLLSAHAPTFQPLTLALALDNLTTLSPTPTLTLTLILTLYVDPNQAHAATFRGKAVVIGTRMHPPTPIASTPRPTHPSRPRTPKLIHPHTPHSLHPHSHASPHLPIPAHPALAPARVTPTVPPPPPPRLLHVVADQLLPLVS